MIIIFVIEILTIDKERRIQKGVISSTLIIYRK